MVWVCEWSQPGMCDQNVTVWNSRDEALAAACADIMDNIHSDWDLSDPDQKIAAEHISDHCSHMHFQDAMEAYNEWEADGDQDVAQYYRVYEAPIQKTVPPIQLLKPLNVNNAVTIPAPPMQEEQYQSTTPGAMCRGPCGTYNEYAYADKRDGTYCCYQCKTFSSLFGGKAP